MAEPLLSLQRDVSEVTDRGFVIHAGDHALPLGDGVLALPFGSL